ncbi:universal stress protein [Kaistella flava (ex Peng et al. 2021)]|uniref:Universal stress protein n=2 Tax=Kaistella flava (ex Peng et al. 2021) TaxID=2038776 RepID=A0A7M2Y6B3_9FLAO|nr:universal stress protein [Kaistella flava (ex Peng et al. 2021)]
MQMKTEIKTILIPIDFTEKSKNALKVAAKMAQRHQAKLIISHTVHIYYMISRSGKQVIGSETVQENTNRATEKLDKLRISLLEKFNIEVETRLCSQNIIDSINDSVESDQIDLVVMGTSGQQKMKQLILGSNSYNVLLHANCSVLLIPEKFKKTSFKKILFPIRVKDELDQKADLSILLANKNDGNINLLGVGDPDRMIEVRKSYIEMKKNLMLKSTDYESEFLLSHDNAEIIAQVAKDKKCDIILLADEDEHSWKSFMADNFFKKMINGTTIPLFIVKSKLKKIKNKTEAVSGYDLTIPALG